LCGVKHAFACQQQHYSIIQCGLPNALAESVTKIYVTAENSA